MERPESAADTTELQQQAVYEEWGRDDVRPYIPLRARSVLEVGCGRGGFGKTLREVLGPEARLVGVEAVPESADIARVDHGFDEVVNGYFPAALDGRPERFDLIAFNDVLEHIYEPWETLRACLDRLTPGGQVLAAVPSIQYLPVVLQLLRGRWDYADTGTLDRTHVRFFTRATMVEMFESAGYRVEVCEGANSMFDQAEHLRWRRLRRLRWATRDFHWMHFVILATKID